MALDIPISFMLNKSRHLLMLTSSMRISDHISLHKNDIQRQHDVAWVCKIMQTSKGKLLDKIDCLCLLEILNVFSDSKILDIWQKGFSIDKHVWKRKIEILTDIY